MVEFLIKNLFCICGINFAGIRHPLTSTFAPALPFNYVPCFIFCTIIEQFYQTGLHERTSP